MSRGISVTRRALVAALVAAALAGCASTPSTAVLLAQGKEATCQCCNCLIPAGTKPDAMCPACDCGHVVKNCDLGRH